MRFRRLFIFPIILLGAASGLFGQYAFGFTNLDGFPDVVAQGVHYDISGWIVNNGTAPISGSFRVEMKVDQGSALSLDNSFVISTPLQPGDSIYWSKTNHNFPPGHFRLGLNDVLIWPTSPAFPNADVDSLVKPVYFSESAIFRLETNGFQQISSGINIHRSYNMDIEATNISELSNTKTVLLYAKIADHDPIEIDRRQGIFDQGEVVNFRVHHLEIDEIFDINYDNIPSKVEFFVLERDFVEPYNRLNYAVEGAVAVDQTIEGTQVSIFPNPSSGYLNIAMPDNWKADANIKLFDLSGREVLKVEKVIAGFQTDELQAGLYLLQLSSAKGEHKQLIQIQ